MSAEGATKHSDTRTFDTLQAFARAISHSIRTPLAVISNDLHYLAGRDVSGVATTTATQCHRIAAILDLVGSLGATGCTRTETTLEQLTRELPPDSISITVDGDNSIRASLDRARFLTIFRLAATLISVDAANVLVSVRGERAGFRCSIHSAHADGGTEANDNGSSLLTQWPDRIEAPLLTTLVDAHGGIFECITPDKIVFFIPGRF